MDPKFDFNFNTCDLKSVHRASVIALVPQTVLSIMTAKQHHYSRDLTVDLKAHALSRTAKACVQSWNLNALGVATSTWVFK